MLSYTKASLKLHLQTWVEGNGIDADDAFVAGLDEIIGLAEIECFRDLDLDNLNSVNTATTAGTVPEVFRPENLIVEDLLVISIDGVKSQLHKRTRAFVEAMNRSDTQGSPKYYAEFDENRWFTAPIADDAYLIFVHGHYTPASIVDGDDSNTTWLSTRLPDVFVAACESKAAQLLKNWNLKAVADDEYKRLLADARGVVAKLRTTDIEDMIQNRRTTQQPTVPPEPAAN